MMKWLSLATRVSCKALSPNKGFMKGGLTITSLADQATAISRSMEQGRSVQFQSKLETLDPERQKRSK